VRKLIGCLVLIAGLGGLGHFAMIHTAPRLQTKIAAAVSQIAGGAEHPLSVDVSGRDIAVSSLVTDTEQADVLRGQFAAIAGVRMLDMGAVEVLPKADPFEISFQADAVGAITAVGVIPSEVDRGALSKMTSADLGDLTLAAGVPDDAWLGVLETGLGALNMLGAGELRVTDREVFIEGSTPTPLSMREVTDAFAALPVGYTLVTDIEVLDDGLPLQLSISLTDGTVDATGKIPPELALEEITDRFQAREGLEVTQAIIPAFDPDWPLVANAGMVALGSLMEGSLTLVGSDLSLNGVGSPDGIAAAEALLAGLPSGYSVTTDLGVFGANIPFEMQMEWDGKDARTSGTFPADFVPRGPLGEDAENSGEVMFLPDTKGIFTANAEAGVAALGLLNRGTLRLSQDALALSGIATSPQVGDAVDEVLASVAPDTVITRDLTFLDDGSPASWRLEFAAATGGSVEGRLPNGLNRSAIADALGLADLLGTPGTAIEDFEIGNALTTLRAIAPYLSDVETLDFAIDGEESSVDLIMSPGVDLELVAGELAGGLPREVALSIAPITDLPADGTRRTHQASGGEQQLRFGFWLPVVEVACRGI